MLSIVSISQQCSFRCRLANATQCNDATENDAQQRKQNSAARRDNQDVQAGRYIHVAIAELTDPALETSARRRDVVGVGALGTDSARGIVLALSAHCRWIEKVGDVRRHELAPANQIDAVGLGRLVPVGAVRLADNEHRWHRRTQWPGDRERAPRIVVAIAENHVGACEVVGAAIVLVDAVDDRNARRRKVE